MMKTDIRTKTGLIILRDGEYLIGFNLFDNGLNWTTSKYDAWFTRNKADAVRVAAKVDGELVLFNPIIGKTKMLEA